MCTRSRSPRAARRSSTWSSSSCISSGAMSPRTIRNPSWRKRTYSSIVTTRATYGSVPAPAMATMCALLSDIDLLAGLRPVRVSAGEVVYPPGGTLGPRWQHDVQLVLLHTGSARITIDDGAPSLDGADAVVLLLPGHRERFEFDPTNETHHSWVQLGLADPPDALDALPRELSALPRELPALPRELPASGALTELVREAVAVARTPISTTTPLLAALATAALLRYMGEAESRVGGTADTVGRARRSCARASRIPTRTSAASRPPRT